LRAAGRLLDITAIELSLADDTYAWDRVAASSHFRQVTLFHQRDVVHEKGRELSRRIHAALDEAGPEAVALPGWSDRGALAALLWCVRRRVPAVLMSESTAHDERRGWCKETLKRRVVHQCRAALVGGQAHAEYLAGLGMARDRIFLGYDVVDNDHFRAGADAARGQSAEVRQRLGLPETYFLASGRFIAKKNFASLLHAYARYRALAGSRAWGLVLLGDGELRPALEQLRDDLGLKACVQLPGFRQYDVLPAYYGLAGAFVHASTVEQWGLVVNEAMAAGLPVLVARPCGCAPDLVREGRNGFTFDPFDMEGLARLLYRTAYECDRVAMGQASREIIGNWSPETFASNLGRAVSAALAAAGPRASWVDRTLILALSRR
jgi:glycosyltransferase involved in cell wall biosynthesis